MSALFEITRADGRSHAQVLLDYVAGGESGRVYTYEELGAALVVGTARVFGVADVRGVVVQAFGRMLREQQRVLKNVRLVGYQLAPARDHNQIALTRKRRSDVQMHRGLQTLQYVREGEMTDDERTRHRGTLMLIAGLWANQQALEKRQRSVEQAIAQLTQRVNQIEKVESNVE